MPAIRWQRPPQPLPFAAAREGRVQIRFDKFGGDHGFAVRDGQAGNFDLFAVQIDKRRLLISRCRERELAILDRKCHRCFIVGGIVLARCFFICLRLRAEQIVVRRPGRKCDPALLVRLIDSRVARAAADDADFRIL